jgi:hypothetical protein
MGIPMTRSFLLSLAAAAVCWGVAHAQTAAQLDAKTIDDWRTVDLGSGVSIDVPKAVGDDYRPKNKADTGLMLFRASVKDAGDIYCGLDRLAYNRPPLGMNRNRALDFLTNAGKDVFCRDAGINAHLALAEEAKSGQGYPGARCAASFFEVQGEKADGGVVEARVVVAPDAVYVLSCTVNDQDQGRAETAWDGIWRKRIAHIEDSLKLP